MNPPSRPPLRGLYLLTPDRDDAGALVAELAPLLAHAALVQYRNKTADAGTRRRQAGAVLAACRAAGVPVLVNDDWRLAAELGADGAHLGRDDGDLAQARAALGAGALLGVSCYADLTRAEAAAAAGANYLAFGAFHPSGTKPAAPRAHPSLLADSARLGLPRVAIGGITPDNGRALVAAGADLLAVIGAVFAAPDPLASARAFADCFTDPS